MNRPYVLTIAGHDPSSGAGLNADIKTFEQFETNGLSVCSALTVQDEDQFLSVQWVDKPLIIEQLKPLLERYQVDFIKVGLIQSFDVLVDVLKFIKEFKPEVKIVWDPIISATSGFRFHDAFDKLTDLLQYIYVLTPNRNEISQLTGVTNSQEAAVMLSNHVGVLLKGGHAENHATDMLYMDGEKAFEIEGDQFESTDKHGTGCVLSAAIIACLSKGDALELSCEKAKRYVEAFLQSNETRLGYHT